MKKKLVFFAFLFVACCFQLTGQQYTAREYWKLEQDSTYKSLKQRQLSGTPLTSEEENYLADYTVKLNAFLGHLSDEQLSEYYKNRKIWTEQKGTPVKMPGEENEEVFAGDKSTYTQYLISSGTYGFFYGWAADYVFSIKGEAVAGFPLVLAGASTIIPMLTIKDKKVSSNSLQLSLHGKAIGAFQGTMLGLLLLGDNLDSKSNIRFLVGLTTASSISLGYAGYALGRTQSWSQGRVSLYRLYGWLIPLEGMAIDFAFKADDPRIYGATSLLFGVGGYLIADKIASRNDFTSGDVTSLQSLTFLNAMLGFGIGGEFKDPDQSIILLPAATTLGGTLLGQRWLKDARFSKQQGRNTALAASGGALIGFGLAVIISPHGYTPYYLFPYIAGMGAYSLLTETYRKENLMNFNSSETPNRWEFNFMPQNILINRKFAVSGLAVNSKRLGMLPAFSASLRF